MKRAYQLLIYFRDNFGEYITEFNRVLSSSLCKCMAPSKTSISMSLFLMSRWTFLMFLEPLKLNRADCKSANKTWAVTQEIAVEYCSSFSEAVSSEISLHTYWFWSDEDFIDSLNPGLQVIHVLTISVQKNLIGLMLNEKLTGLRKKGA